MLAPNHLHLRIAVPDWVPMIFSHEGEMLPEFEVFEVIETLSALVKANYGSAVRSLDGLTPKQVVANYRMRLKNELACSVAYGYGNILM